MNLITLAVKLQGAHRLNVEPIEKEPEKEPRILFGRGEGFYSFIAGEDFGFTGRDCLGDWVYMGMMSGGRVRVSKNTPHKVLFADSKARIRSYQEEKVK